MAFKLVVSDTVVVPVRGTILDDAGASQSFHYSLVCTRLPADDLRESLADSSDTMANFLRQRVVTGWTGVLGGDDRPLEFSDAALSTLFRVPGMAAVAFRAYLDNVGAKGKN